MTIRHTLAHTVITLAILALAACGRSASGVRGYLTADRLETALSSNDSTTLFLKACKASDEESAETQARIGLLTLMDLHHKGEKPDNDSIARAVVEHYASGERRLRMLSELCAAIAYSDLDENDKAVRLFTEAERSATESTSHSVLYELYTSWGWTIGSERPYEESISKFKKAETHARAIGDYTKVVHAIDLQGWEYLYTNEFDKALRIFDAAIDTARAHGYNGLAALLKSKATALELRGDHREALSYINQALAKTRGDRHTLYAIKGSILTKLGQYDSARICLEQGRQDDHLYQSAAYHCDMASLEAAQGHYPEAFAQMSSYATCLDSFYRHDRYQELIKVQRLYNYSLVAAERNKYALESQRKGTAIAIIVAIIAVVSAVAGYAYNRWRRRLGYAIRMKETLLEQNLAKIREYSLALTRSKQEAQEKELELMRNLTVRDEHIVKLRQEQQQLKQQMFRTDEVIRKIENLRKMQERKKISEAKQIVLTTDERQNMIGSANLCYDRFADRLQERFEGLSTDDLCLCCLLKMGVSAQDQCILLGTSDATLRKRKYRLKNKKMMLGDDYDTLDSFISAF